MTSAKKAKAFTTFTKWPLCKWKKCKRVKAKHYPVLTSCIIWLQRIFHVVGSYYPQLVCEISVGTFSDVKNASFEVSRSIFHLCNDDFARHQSFVNHNLFCPHFMSRQSNQMGLDFLTLTEINFSRFKDNSMRIKYSIKWQNIV